MKFKFEITAGVLLRKDVRASLNRSKDTLMYQYPDSNISVREEKHTFESIFYIQGTNLPDDSESVIRSWISKIKRVANA